MQKESNIKLHTVLKKIINYEGWVQDVVGVFETEPPNELTRQAFVLKKTARQTWSASFPIQNLEQKQNNGHKTRKKKRKKKNAFPKRENNVSVSSHNQTATYSYSFLYIYLRIIPNHS